MISLLIAVAQTAAALGLTFPVVGQHDLADGIHAARLLLPRCWFDATKCARGIDALRQYRKTWNARLGEFTGVPVHDQFSHGADSFRGLAVRHKTPAEKTAVKWLPVAQTWAG